MKDDMIEVFKELLDKVKDKLPREARLEILARHINAELDDIHEDSTRFVLLSVNGGTLSQISNISLEDSREIMSDLLRETHPLATTEVRGHA